MNQTDIEKTKEQLIAENEVLRLRIKQYGQLESQLRQAQKMEAIGAMAGGIAHDFNNILSIIIGYTEISLDLYNEPEKVKSNLEHMLKGANRAKDLVRQILTFSRQAEMRPGPVKVAAIVQEVLNLIRASLPSTINIQQSIHNENYMIYADQTQLHQVLMNLCTNSAHAMKNQNGLLEVEVSDMNYDLTVIGEESTVPSPYMRLTVRDNGCGMTCETKDRIFDPFFTTKSVGEGTGLGLSVVQGIVASWNGEITVESEPGKGTAFHLFLPLIQEDIDFDSDGTSKIPIPLGSGRILLVDDEQAIADMGRKMLTQLGYTVVSKTKSIDALETFSRDPDSFQLVITDLTMPDLTGIQLAKELAVIKPDIPVIACSGYVQELNPNELTDLGIKELLRKPFNKKQIAKMINRVLGAPQQY